MANNDGIVTMIEECRSRGMLTSNATLIPVYLVNASIQNKTIAQNTLNVGSDSSRKAFCNMVREWQTNSSDKCIIESRDKIAAVIEMGKLHSIRDNNGIINRRHSAWNKWNWFKSSSSRSRRNWSWTRKRIFKQTKCKYLSRKVCESFISPIHWQRLRACICRRRRTQNSNSKRFRAVRAASFVGWKQWEIAF